jgi:hypothetical protein
MKFWSRTEKKDKKEKNKWHYTAVSAEVEMTAYALLAHITGEQQNAAINAKPIVMWLTKQRNPRGGCADEKPSFLLFGKYILFICYAFCESVDHEKCGQVKNTLKVECVDELW